MGEGTMEKKTFAPANMGPFTAFVLISVSCCLATVVVAIIAATIVSRWSTFDSGALFAVSTMVACPAFLGVGVSFFVAKTANFLTKTVDRLD
jgi:hypothetical protein